MRTETNYLGTVPLDLLLRYLTATQWQRQASPELSLPRVSSAAMRLLREQQIPSARNFDVFVPSNPDWADVELIVPQHSSSRDYASQMQRALAALASFENRDPLEVAQDVRSVGFDVLRSRIPDTYVKDDSIDLAKAESFIVGIRAVLATAATVELDPSPYFARLKKEGKEYANRCRFGHTFKGSFGFIVESPLEANNQSVMTDIEAPLPFERRVLERLAQGFTALDLAVETNSTKPIVQTSARGLNANVCEQLARLVEETAHAALAFEFAFSPEWKSSVPLPPDYNPDEGFVLGPKHVEAARDAARELRRLPEPRRVVVFGRVVKLASQANPSDANSTMGEREVDLLWSSEELGDITVRTSLNRVDYLAALEAHKAGLPIQVAGLLEPRRRGWRLLEANIEA